MEKRNIIEQGRTPDLGGQDGLDMAEKSAAASFVQPRKCTRCEDLKRQRITQLHNSRTAKAS